MKIALIADSILKRDHYLEFVEKMRGLFPEASLFTYAYNSPNIIGPITQGRIDSSYLSNMVSDETDFNRKSYLCPHIAKTFDIDCNTDWVISISKGFAHGVKIPTKAKHLSYIYDLDLKFQGLLGKTLSSFTKTWVKDSFKNIDRLIVAREGLKELISPYYDKEIEVIPPGFDISHYPKNELTEKEYYLVNADGVTSRILRDFETRAEQGEKFIFIGDHKNLKSSNQNIEFYGERCVGDLASLFSKSKCLIDLSSSSYPNMALGSLAMGRPVVLKRNQKNEEYIKEENAIFVEKPAHIFPSLNSLNEFDSVKLRRNALKYTDLKLKMHLADIL